MSLGANLGGRLEYLRLGVTVLQPFSVSPVFETAPLGGVPQPDYLNLDPPKILVARCGGE